MNLPTPEQTHSEIEQQEVAVLLPELDPLWEYIGAVSHGALAQGIDDELYPCSASDADVLPVNNP